MDFKETEVWKNAILIVKKLLNNGFKAFFVGGCVRDMINGDTPKDIDISTNASPEQIQKMFKRTIPVGAQFGVIIVLIDSNQYEVATFRSDGKYADGRHPEEVFFSNEVEDAKRRDFTINGLFYEPIDEKIIDYVNGQEDFKKKIIKCIGDPVERFEEDKLRMIRAVRFSSKYNFEIEEQTKKTIIQNAEKIMSVSIERIRDEINKILTDKNPDKGILLLDEMGLLKEILPEVTTLKGVEQPKEFHPEGDVWQHTLIMLSNMKNPSKELAFAVLLHDIGKPSTFKIEDRIRFDGHDIVGADIALNICKKLKFSNEETNKIVSLIKEHMRFMNIQKMKKSKLKRFLRQDYFDEHLELHRLDCIGSHSLLDNYYFALDKIKEFSSENKEELRPKPLITGNDLIELGFTPGPNFKEIINTIEDLQLENQLSTKEEALDFIKKTYSY